MVLAYRLHLEDDGAVGLGIEGLSPDAVFRSGGQGIGEEAFGVFDEKGIPLVPVLCCYKSHLM